MSKGKVRIFSRVGKLEVIERLEAAERASKTGLRGKG